jgi:hypothetical protein
MPQSADRPDIEIGAAVKAKKLRFDRVPDPEVQRVGDWSSVSERENLPSEVEEGVTYRDVEVSWNVQARIATEINDEIEAKMREERA